MMRALLIATTALAALYGGYWAYGSRLAQSQAQAMLDTLAAEGLAAPAEASITGFPSRFDLTLAPLDLRNARDTLRWQAPFLQIFALSYRPHHLIAAWPHEQVLGLGPLDLAIDSAEMRASAVVDALAPRGLERARFVARDLVLRPAQAAPGTGLALGELRLASQRSDPESRSQDFGLEALRLGPAAIAPANRPGQWLRLSGRAEWDQPLRADTFANPERAAPRLQILRFNEIALRWGAIDLTGSGQIRIGGDGTPEGQLDLAARDWRGLLALAAESGMLQPDIARTYGQVLEQFAAFSGSGDDLSAPLIFRGGWMFLGPLPLGLAPRF